MCPIIMLDSRQSLLFLKLCQHNLPKPSTVCVQVDEWEELIARVWPARLGKYQWLVRARFKDNSSVITYSKTDFAFPALVSVQ